MSRTHQRHGGDGLVRPGNLTGASAHGRRPIKPVDDHDDDGWYFVAPGDPADERYTWLSLDPSEAAEQLLLDHDRRHMPVRRKHLMKHREDEITADRIARDGHVENHAAIARRSNEGRDA